MSNSLRSRDRHSGQFGSPYTRISILWLMLMDKDVQPLQSLHQLYARRSQTFLIPSSNSNFTHLPKQCLNHPQTPVSRSPLAFSLTSALPQPSSSPFLHPPRLDSSRPSHSSTLLTPTENGRNPTNKILTDVEN